MATIVLDDSQVKIRSLRTRWVTQKFRVETQNLVNIFQSNGAARLDVRAVLFTTTKEGRDYIEGVVLAAEYNNDPIQFTLPSEFYEYDGTPASDDIKVDGAVTAGSNTLTLFVDGVTETRPTGNTLGQGMIIQFDGDDTLYRINSYNASTGVAVVFPNIRKAIADETTVEYQAPKYTGFITNTPGGTYRAGADGYVSYDLRLQEKL